MNDRAKDQLGPLLRDKQTPIRALACRDPTRLTMLACQWWMNVNFHQLKTVKPRSGGVDDAPLVDGLRVTIEAVLSATD